MACKRSQVREVLQTGEVLTIQADLGGRFNVDSPKVQVFATQNADGTGNAVLLTEVGRTIGSGEGYNLTTVVSAPSAAIAPSIAGYFVQVYIPVPGYYDNFVVTSTIPEPATMSLLCLGGLLLRRKK